METAVKSNPGYRICLCVVQPAERSNPRGCMFCQGPSQANQLSTRHLAKNLLQPEFAPGGRRKTARGRHDARPRSSRETRNKNRCKPLCTSQLCLLVGRIEADPARRGSQRRTVPGAAPTGGPPPVKGNYRRQWSAKSGKDQGSERHHGSTKTVFRRRQAGHSALTALGPRRSSVFRSFLVRVPCPGSDCRWFFSGGFFR